MIDHVFRSCWVGGGSSLFQSRTESSSPRQVGADNNIIIIIDNQSVDVLCVHKCLRVKLSHIFLIINVNLLKLKLTLVFVSCRLLLWKDCPVCVFRKSYYAANWASFTFSGLLTWIQQHQVSAALCSDWLLNICEDGGFHWDRSYLLSIVGGAPAGGSPGLLESVGGRGGANLPVQPWLRLHQEPAGVLFHQVLFFINTHCLQEVSGPVTLSSFYVKM